MKSLSEIDTTSKRASRAVGFSWGEAEEIGKSVRLLELFGLPGIKNLNQYYHLKINQKFDNLNLIKENNISEKNSYCPITLGIKFLDQIRSLEKYKKIKFNNILVSATPLLFVFKSNEINTKSNFLISLKFEENFILFLFFFKVFNKSGSL